MAVKLFDSGDVLPATTQLRIIADIPNASENDEYGAYTTNEYLRVIDYNDNGVDYGFVVKVNGSYLNLSNYNLSELVNGKWVSCEYVEYNIMSVIIDTSTWTETQRTIVNVNAGHPIYWEDLNAPSGYSITFEENGGSTVIDLTEQTALPTPLPTTTKSGYTFVNWYYDSAFTQSANAGDTIESNVTLYAKWTLPTYTITFEENGGSTVTDLTEQTALPNPLPIPTKENHSFLGWYYDSDFTNEAFADDPLTGDVTLYAKWEEISLGYTITFDSNGGSSVSQVSGVAFLPSTLPTPTKSNLVFGGWFYESNFTTKALANDTLTSDVTLYAKWLDTSALLLKLNAIRNALKTSINAKGGTLTTETLDQYASAVDGIQIAVELTQAQYDALTTPDTNTYYIVMEEE